MKFFTRFSRGVTVILLWRKTSMDFTGNFSGIKYKLRSRGLAFWKALQQLKLNFLHLLTECESYNLAGGSVLIQSPLYSEIFFPMCVTSFAVSLIVLAMGK